VGRVRILRAGEDKPRTFEVKRAHVDVPEVSWEMLPGNPPLFHLAIQEFGMRAHNSLLQALAEAQKQGARGLLVDVRGNPGWLKKEAVAVTGAFLDKGQVIFIQTDAQGQEEIRSREEGVARGLPVCVLIDEGTASSAEIFAGALQDHGRAKLVGARTFGTGTVLQPFKLSDDSAVLLAVAQWLTPKGRKIWHEGIEPDVKVSLPEGASILLPESGSKLTEEALSRSEDKQLLEAREVLRKQLAAGDKATR